MVRPRGAWRAVDRGGTQGDSSLIRRWQVSRISAGGAVDRAGKLRVGDKILSLNGVRRPTVVR